MSYAQVDTRAARNLKLARVSGDARWVWVQGLCFVQDAKTDGFIPLDAVPALGLPVPHPDWVRELLTVRLWETTRGGYQIHDYLQWNSPASVRDEKREAARLRMERFRKREKAGRTIDAHAENQPLLHAAQEGPPGPEPPPPSDGELAPIREALRPNSGTKPRATAPLIVSPREFHKMQQNVGYLGVRFRVPLQFHRELVSRYGGDEGAAERALQAFYEKLDTSVGDHESIPNIYQFINGHFAKLVEGRAASVPAPSKPPARADDQRQSVSGSMRDQLTQAAKDKTP